MSKKAYVGLNNIARNTIKVRVGVDNISRNVLKGYVGDENGIARQWWPSKNPWDDYAGEKLVFNYDYQPNITYTRYRADIIDTIKYAIRKTIFLNRGIDYEAELDLIESKFDEIIDYFRAQIHGDNTVIFQTSLNSSFNPISFTAWMGSQFKNYIKVISITDQETYRRIYHETRDPQSGQLDEGDVRVQVTVKLYPNGNLDKSISYSPSMGNLGFIIGNDVDDVFYTSSGICYLQYISNVGVHFENFNSGNLVANWDFTQSVLDTVEQVVGCRELIWGGSTIDSSGLHLNVTAYGDGISVPSWIFRYANTFELTISGNYTTTYSQVNLFSCNKGSVVLQYNVDHWEFQDVSNYSSILREPIGVTDFNYFNNSKIKVHYNEYGNIYLYKNGVLVYTTNIVKMRTLAKCGDPMGILGAFKVTVTKLKFYNE